MVFIIRSTFIHTWFQLWCGNLRLLFWPLAIKDDIILEAFVIVMAVFIF